jgi:hypothetical protein
MRTLKHRKQARRRSLVLDGLELISRHLGGLFRKFVTADATLEKQVSARNQDGITSTINLAGKKTLRGHIYDAKFLVTNCRSRFFWLA